MTILAGCSSLRLAMVFGRVFNPQFHGSKVRQQLGGGVFERRNDCGFVFTCLAVKQLTNLAVKRSTSLAVKRFTSLAVKQSTSLAVKRSTKLSLGGI